MAQIQNFPGSHVLASPVATYDITSTTAERVGSFLYYFAFGTDGTMFVLHTAGNTILGWSQFDGDVQVQTATATLALQPFLDNLNGRNPSSTRAMAYFMGGDDLMTGSKASDDLRGLAGADTLLGGGGRDHLSGGAGADHLTGGSCADTLTGGADADHFVFNSSRDGGDTITDFNHGQDQIDLVAAAFGFAGGLVQGQNFSTDGTMSSTAPTLLYTAATGVLGYDPDGTGSMAAVLLASLSNHAMLDLSDFTLV